MTASSNEYSDNKDSVQKPSRFFILLAGFSFALPTLLLYLYSNNSNTFEICGIEIRKIQNQEESIDELLSEFEPVKEPLATDSKQLKASIDTLMPSKEAFSGLSDTSRQLATHAFSNYDISDTTKHRVMIIGDSECGGLCFPLNDYCIENGHKLVLSFVWNSATIFNFAHSDTITRVLQKYKPSYVFLVLGLNELYAKDLKRRKQAADLLAQKMNGIPYAWIGPANYMEDFGINKVFESAADSGSFFMTNGLQLPRGSDGRHPSNQGYRIWMDSIASWMHLSSKYKIALKRPVKRNYSFKSQIMTLHAAKFRGY